MALPRTSGATGSDAVRKGTPARRRLLWASLPAALAAGVAAGVLYPRGEPSRGLVISSLMPPAGAEYYLGGKQPGPVSVSPDGTRIAFAARDEAHGVLLWVRALDTPDAVPLTGTENGSYPFWSPDGRSIGFFADGKLKRVDAAGGAPLTLADAPFGKGGTWNAGGTILFAPSYNSRHPADSGPGRDTAPSHGPRPRAPPEQPPVSLVPPGRTPFPVPRAGLRGLGAARERGHGGLARRRRAETNRRNRQQRRVRIGLSAVHAGADPDGAPVRP